MCCEMSISNPILNVHWLGLLINYWIIHHDTGTTSTMMCLNRNIYPPRNQRHQSFRDEYDHYLGTLVHHLITTGDGLWGIWYWLITFMLKEIWAPLLPAFNNANSSIGQKPYLLQSWWNLLSIPKLLPRWNYLSIPKLQCLHRWNLDWEWISNFILQMTGHMVTYPCRYYI